MFVNILWNSKLKGLVVMEKGCGQFKFKNDRRGREKNLEKPKGLQILLGTLNNNT